MTAKYLFTYFIEENRIELRLPQDRIIYITPLEAHRPVHESSSDRLDLKAIWEGSTLRYDLLDSSVKESIFLDSKSSPTKFQFKIWGHSEATFQDDSIYFLDDRGVPLYQISRPFVRLSNQEIETGHNAVRHAFDPDTGIYTLEIGEFGEEFYPLEIDPTISILDSFGGQTVSAFRNSKLLLVGSDSVGTELSPANKLIITGKPEELVGSDQVTFNSSIHAYLDYISKSTFGPNVSGIRITSNSKVTNVVSDKNPDVLFMGSLSPVAVVTRKANEKYYFTLKVSDSIETLTNFRIQTSLRKTADGAVLADTKYGTVNTATLNAGSNSGKSYNITYTSPASVPATIEDRNLLLVVTISFSFSIGNQLQNAIKQVYASIQISNQPADGSDWVFMPNAAKVDPICGDYYAPLQSGGCICLDISLGLVGTINSGLPENAITYCANRIGTPKDPRGVLVCTSAGVYYYATSPWDEPQTFLSPIKITNTVMCDFVQSAHNLFFLDFNGILYRFGYAHLLSYISGATTDISSIIDASLLTANHRPFHQSNVGFGSPYVPQSGHRAEKLLPISLRADWAH
jgi:hypothetical protein